MSMIHSKELKKDIKNKNLNLDGNGISRIKRKIEDYIFYLKS